MLLMIVVAYGASGFHPRAHREDSARRWTTGALAEVVSRTAIAETRQIDTGQSKLTVFVYKSGLFSAFADDHVIDGAIADQQHVGRLDEHRGVGAHPSPFLVGSRLVLLNALRIDDRGD